MIINLIAGIITGFVVSIPPMGPIAFAIISKGFKNEIKEGRSIALGAAAMDLFYCLMAFGGVTLIISFLPAAASDFYAENNYLIKIILTFLGCAVVIYYGVKIMKSKISYNQEESIETGKYISAFAKADKLLDNADKMVKRFNIKKVSNTNSFGLFFLGVLLCLSSLTLPASWIAIIGYLKGYNFLNSTFAGGLLFSLGAFTGTLVWFRTLLKIITGNKKRITGSAVNKLNIIAGVVLLLLGVILFVKASASVFHILNI